MQDKDFENFIVIQLCAVDMPVFKEDRTKTYVKFGEDNKYPNQLLDLYNGSAKHNALVSGKVNFIYGGGLQLTNEADLDGWKWFNRVNRHGDTLNDISRRSINDIRLYGGFYWLIIPSAIGFEIYHLSFERWRSNKENTQFYFKENWQDNREEMKTYPVFDPTNKKTASVYFFKEYRPGVHTYCLPDYIGAINFINADVEVGKHTYTNASAGFNASKMLNFFNGSPADEKKRDIERRIKAKFTGSIADKIIITFNDDPAKTPTILDLGASDLTKEDFTAVDDLIQQNIFAGHQITSPQLFGIQNSGQWQLGGRDELRTSYEIFKNTYCNNKQQEYERVVNMFAGYLGLSTQFKLKDVEPVGFELSEATLLQIAPKEYLLEKAGIDLSLYQDKTPALPPANAPNAPSKPNGSLNPAAQLETDEPVINSVLTNLTGRQHQQVLRVINQYKKGKLDKAAATELLKAGYGFTTDQINSLLGISNKTFQKFEDESDDEIIAEFAKVGKPKQGFIKLKSKPVFFSSDSDMIEDELNLYQSGFASEVSNLDAKVLEIIKKDKRATNEVIAKALKISVEDAQNEVASLSERGLISISTVTEQGQETQIKELNQPISDVTDKDQRVEISIRYSYEGPQDSRNRPFCAKLMELDRFYTRMEIQSISAKLGYSVWDRRGGFWTHKDGTVTPYCRHTWSQSVVAKKVNK